jgi:hypothetical protein
VTKINPINAQAELPSGDTVRKWQAQLKVSLSVRAGLVLAAVWLMTVKPDFAYSLGSVLVLVILSWGSGALIATGARRDPGQRVGVTHSEVENRSR